MKFVLIFFALMMCTVESIAQPSRSYVKTYKARKNITSNLSEGNIDEDRVQQIIQYMDGLGRPIQTVMRRGSHDRKDVIAIQTYDAYSRVAQQYLPYKSNTTSGVYQSNSYAQQAHFFNSRFGNESDGFAYAETRYESSSLGRLKAIGAPGSSWRLGADHEVKYQYRVNGISDDVWMLSVDGSTLVHGSPFGAGQLFVQEIVDENSGDQQGQVVEFKDKKGRLILKRIREHVDPVRYLDTYYVYDELDRLKYVIPPEAVRQIEQSNNWELLNSATFLYQWVFRYEHDSRGRMVSKKIPGSAWMYMIYDKRDRIVLVQEGNQRSGDEQLIEGHQVIGEYRGVSYRVSPGSSLTLGSTFSFNKGDGESFRVVASQAALQEWTFTKYDTLNRPVMTGIYSTTLSREALQKLVDDVTDFSIAYTGSGELYGYDNSSFPQTKPEDLLTVTYYDNYQFLNDYDFPAAAPDDYNQAVRGLVTGARNRILGEDRFIATVTWYDDRYRPVQTSNSNHLNGVDVAETTYRNTVSSLISEVLTTHSSDHLSGLLKVKETFTYDHMDRLLLHTHQIDDNDQVELIKNTYNDLGELSAKEVGNGVQQLDYQYNIRGWLTKINDVSNLSDSDQYGMELEYDAAGQYNGNIGRMTWRSLGGLEGNTNVQSFDYTYDPISRLTEAQYHSSGRDGHYNVGNLTYDGNGNIISLERILEGDLVDELSYSYNGNQLIAVEDDSERTGGFVNGVSLTSEYQYDGNGNMVEDANKGIVQIKYNRLNLPEMITFQSGKYVAYQYDVAGIKLKKTTAECETCVSSVTDYVAGKHYVNGQLAFLQHAEGRVLRSSGDFEYEYNLRDHLGNIRVVVKADNLTGNASYELSSSDVITVMSQSNETFTVQHALHDIGTDVIFFWSPYDAERNAFKIEGFDDYELSTHTNITVSGPGTWYLIKKRPGNELISTDSGSGEASTFEGLDGYVYELMGEFTITKQPPRPLVVQRDDYYPFGSTYGHWNAGNENLYKYNGKEEQQELLTYDYGWRQYDSWIARWTAVDNLSERHVDWSPYHYVLNNPLKYVDPNGDTDFWALTENGLMYIGNDGNGNSEIKIGFFKINQFKLLQRSIRRVRKGKAREGDEDHFYSKEAGFIPLYIESEAEQRAHISDLQASAASDKVEYGSGILLSLEDGKATIRFGKKRKGESNDIDLRFRGNLTKQAEGRNWVIGTIHTHDHNIGLSGTSMRVRGEEKLDIDRVNETQIPWYTIGPNTVKNGITTQGQIHVGFIDRHGRFLHRAFEGTNILLDALNLNKE